ncbi:aminotransferase class I/II-fold pyridoxal phosphate-dependent enzyme [Nocardiopsis sp. EMB25]|uniref:threonine aldolase family protein n=1 Tax=Nocardiopsis sp. EMB25 TaxID=2835867 RepID=UPI0022853319|nr:GntG family PLP-dependent aldolase [Nocardiopsis sp. EMB25]MCY9785452.1 aminotransferase class I/II-fold pyridoxal phosphate-dependent enzyme [Nocardiopsis sp. EMB25]
MIDLRSDTVTRPTAAMRRAIAEAEVGDDVYGEDPTVRALEEETAALLGKEAALYVPSGHMANQIALYVSARSGEEVWAHEHHHLIGSEQGAAAVLSRVQPRLYSGDPFPSDDVLADWTRGAGEGDAHRAEPALLWLENTFTGQVVPLAEQRRVVAFAHGHGMRAHLDGARLWNAAAALDAAPAEVAAGFDTVSVCFSKGLGAPVGSALAGDAATVRRARRARKLLGAGMRQAGIIAAGALHALRHHRERIPEDHTRATLLAERIGAAPGLSARARTNMVLLQTPEGSAARLVELLARNGVGAVAIGPSLIRLTVHLDITDGDVDEAANGITKSAQEL